MLRITRLHLILAGIGTICLFFGALNWIGMTEDAMGSDALQEAVSTQQAQENRLKTAPADKLEQAKRHASQTIATVGESYRILKQQYGELAPVSRPLRAAKKYQADGHSDRALASATEAWNALKAFHQKTGALVQTYQVTRGDTLWRIAAAHSPAHDGAGWVTIWKANKDLVSDFNRIEIGWTLTIPQKRAQYVMPFWKPQALN
jgi:nucleoid-associated protein YgaU